MLYNDDAVTWETLYVLLHREEYGVTSDNKVRKPDDNRESETLHNTDDSG